MFVLRKTADFTRFGIVGYKDDTGIGRQCHNMKIVLNIGRHIVAPSKRLPGHGLSAQDRVLLPDARKDCLNALLRDLDGIVVIERNKWHPELFATARKLNKKLILIPNWEWFDEKDPAYDFVDVFIAHSQRTYTFLTGAGFANVIKLLPPIDLAALPLRRIRSPARSFFHNAGLIDRTDRKGTLATLEAWQNKPPTDAQLVIRVQRSDLPMPRIDGMRNVILEMGSKRTIPELYLRGDCAIQPSRLEGLGYMVLEPLLCGIPTITTDAAPMNEWHSGTSLCRAHISRQQSIPHTRGIGEAPLVDVDPATLTAQIQAAEQCDISALANDALHFREQFAHDEVKTQWCEALKHI